MFSDIKFNNKKNLIIIVASVFIIVFLLVITGILLSNNDDNTNNEASMDLHLTDDNNILSGDSSFLVVFEDDKNEIVLALLAEFKIYSQRLVLTPLDKNTLSANGKNYNECYIYGGINLLEKTVEEVRNIEIDRFAVIDKSGINRLTELMGDVSLYISEDFTYATSDKTYTVTTGNNEMGSDMLFTYISLLAGREAGEEKATEVVSKVINSYLNSIDVSDSEDLFGDVTNCFLTNVTITDYYSAKTDIEYLLTNGFECVISNSINS